MRTRMRAHRTAQLTTHLRQALTVCDHMTAYDIFMDISEIGSAHAFYDGSRLIRLLSRAGCVREMVSVYEAMRAHGFCFDAHPLVLERMLFAFARSRFAPGVHAIASELDSSGSPLGDECYERLVHAYFSVGSDDRAFRILDTFRAAGAPVARLLAFALNSTGSSWPSLAQSDAPARMRLIERLPRRILAYLVMSPAVAPEELVALLAHGLRFGRAGGVVVEALATRKVVEAAPPAVLEACAAYLLKARRGGGGGEEACSRLQATCTSRSPWPGSWLSRTSPR